MAQGSPDRVAPASRRVPLIARSENGVGIRNGHRTVGEFSVVTAFDWLHDSRLTAVEVSWGMAAARVIIEVDTVAARAARLPLADTTPAAEEGQSDRAGALVIECEGVERVVIPHEDRWGPTEPRTQIAGSLRHWRHAERHCASYSPIPVYARSRSPSSTPTTDRWTRTPPNVSSTSS